MLEFGAASCLVNWAALLMSLALYQRSIEWRCSRGGPWPALRLVTFSAVLLQHEPHRQLHPAPLLVCTPPTQRPI
ncbi:hypothetical protein IWX91DRAFT_103957 [Phyllosticta citricarpa]